LNTPLRGSSCALTLKNTPTPSRKVWPYSGGIFDPDAAIKRLADLNARTEDSSFWNDPKAAQKMMRERQSVEKALNAFKSFESEYEDALTLIELGEAESPTRAFECRSTPPRS
jgi:hypothetical protein